MIESTCHGNGITALSGYEAFSYNRCAASVGLSMQYTRPFVSAIELFVAGLQSIVQSLPDKECISD